ncbi:MAG: EamA family transporter [Candidatus Marsarchaeota archaeon]|nr:EamA family transporter [Candidatus Marsarchaeota archaeon]
MVTIYLIIFITLVAALIVSFAQILFKSELDRGKMGMLQIIKSLVTDKKILLGIGAYFLSLVIYLYALSEAPLSVVYPLFASSFIFVALFSAKFLKEPLNVRRVIGIALVFAGIAMIAVSYV